MIRMAAYGANQKSTAGFDQGNMARYVEALHLLENPQLRIPDESH